MTMKRRDALKSIGALAGAATMSRLLPACGDSGPEGITTIVAMMMENRSFDHFMGSRSMVEGKQVDGLPPGGAMNPDVNGVMIPSYVANDTNMCDLDPPHSWERARQQLDDGKLDGFVVAHQQANNTTTSVDPMQYLLREHAPTSYALADNYALCDRWFSSVLGPTYPNRYYWHSATANGHMDNTIPSTVWPTIYDRLNEKGIPWTYYYGDLPVLSFLGSSSEGHIKRFEKFAADAKAGTLPPVVYIDPAFALNDDHPPHHPFPGQQLIGAVYAALATSPQWKNILFVVTYDENGGYYDHVVPPKLPDDMAAAGFDQAGFRVPGMVIGPYVKPGYVSSVQYDHTSVLKHIENMFGLAPLTMRDAAANDLSDCIDMDALAKNKWRPPADVPMVMVDPYSLPMACEEGIVPRIQPPYDPRATAQPFVHHDVLAWADANPDLLRGWDRRGDLDSYVKCLQELTAPYVRK